MSIAETLTNLGKTLPQGSVFDFDIDRNTVVLEKLVIPSPRKGTGTWFLALILAATDQAGMTCRLYADPTDEPGDPDTFDLVRWYCRFGFALDHVNDHDWVGMVRSPQPWCNGKDAILADYRHNKENLELTRKEFERWREEATDRMWEAKEAIGRNW